MKKRTLTLPDLTGIFFPNLIEQLSYALVECRLFVDTIS